MVTQEAPRMYMKFEIEVLKGVATLKEGKRHFYTKKGEEKVLKIIL